MGFLAKIEKVALGWAKGSNSDWFPWWYNGATTTQYYPPLATWIPAAIQLATYDVFATFKIVCWVSFFTGGLAATHFAARLGLSVYSAATGGILYATGTYTLYTVLGDGTIGRALSLPLFPLLLDALLELSDRKTTRVWIKTALLVAALILVHAMHAYLIFICSGVALLVYVIQRKGWFHRLAVVSSACIAGLLLTGFWSVPGYLQMDIPGVPAPGVGWEVLWATTLATLVRSNVAGNYVLYGMSVLGSLVSWKSNRRACSALIASAALAISLIYGVHNPLYRLLPLHSSLAPIRFLNAASLPCSVLGAFAVDHVIKKAVRRPSHILPFLLLMIVSGLCVHEARWRNPVSNPVEYVSIRDSTRMLGYADDPFRVGRVVTEATLLNSEQAYFALNHGFNLSNGWNIEGTPHAETYRQFNQCYGHGYEEYVVSQWALWNVRGVIIDDRSPRLLSMLENQGWHRQVSDGGLTILRSGEASAYFQKYLSRVLVIGRSSFHLRKVIPSITEGSNPDPLSYEDDYLDLFEVLYLYDLPPLEGHRERLEQWILRWIKRGKRVVVDMSSTQMPDLFGVRVRQMTVSGSLTLSATPGSPLASAVIELSEGTAASYSGLDKVWMTVEVDGNAAAVCGIRELQHGDVCFIGLHLPRLSTATSKQEVADLLSAIIGPRHCSRIEQGIPFDVEARWDDRGVSFDYDSDYETPLVISITYTQRWHATIDGSTAPIYRNESLILMILPSGSHSVRLTYGRSPAVYLGWAVSLAGVSLCVVCSTALKRLERHPIRREESLS